MMSVFRRLYAWWKSRASTESTSATSRISTLLASTISLSPASRVSISPSQEMKVTATIAQTSPLLGLPSEIIVLIVDSLPTITGACLALSCRRLRYVLGSDLSKSLRDETVPKGVRMEFLSFLAKDSADHFVCQECISLHRYSTVYWPSQPKYPGSPLCLQILTPWRGSLYNTFDPTPLSYDYRLHFSQIHLVMEQHRSGIDIGFPVEALDTLEFSYDNYCKMTSLLSVEAKIIQNEIYLRTQSWLWFPVSQRCHVIKRWKRYGVDSPIHCSQNSSGLPTHFTSKMLQSQSKLAVQMFQCPRCWSDHAAEVVDFGEFGFAVVATKWFNLGAGLSIRDEKWQSVVCYWHDSTTKKRHEDIRGRFESHADISMGELTRNNRTKLIRRAA